MEILTDQEQIIYRIELESLIEKFNKQEVITEMDIIGDLISAMTVHDPALNSREISPENKLEIISDHLKTLHIIKKKAVKCNVDTQISMLGYFYESNLLKFMEKKPEISIVQLFENYVFQHHSLVGRPFSLLNTHFFLRVLDYFQEKQDKIIECEEFVAKIHQDFKMLPQICQELIMMLLNRYSGMTISVNLSKATLEYKSRTFSIDIFKGETNFGSVYKIEYSQRGEIIKQVCSDMNVFLNLNRCCRGIRFIGMFSGVVAGEVLENREKVQTSYMKSISLCFNNFGIPLFKYIKKESLKLDDGQILFLLKTLARNALILLENGIAIEFLHPANVFVSDEEGIWILPSSYASRCFVEKLEMGIKAFKDPRIEKKSDLSIEEQMSSICYSLGVLFIYMKEKKIEKSWNLEKFDELSGKYDNNIRGFLQGVLCEEAARKSLEDITDEIIYELN